MRTYQFDHGGKTFEIDVPDNVDPEKAVEEVIQSMTPATQAPAQPQEPSASDIGWAGADLATMGLSTHGRAAAAALGDETYAQALRRIRGEQERTMEAATARTIGAGVGMGMLIPGIGTVGAARTAGMGLLARAGQAAARSAIPGAVMGGTSGAIGAAGPEATAGDVAARAITGAAGGAVGGAVLGPVVQEAARVAPRALRGLGMTVEDTSATAPGAAGGAVPPATTPATARAASRPGEGAFRIGGEMLRSGVDPESVAARLREARYLEPTLIGAKVGEQQAQAAALLPGEGRGILRSYAERFYGDPGRSTGESVTAAQRATEMVTPSTTSRAAEEARLVAQRSAQADQAYTLARQFDLPSAITPTASRVLESDVAARAVRLYNRQAGATSGTSLDATLAPVRMINGRIDPDSITMAQADMIYRIMRDQGESLAARGQKTVALKPQTAARELYGELARINPDYGVAVNSFREASVPIEAMIKADKWMDKDMGLDEWRSIVQPLTTEGREAVRIAVAESIRNQAASTRGGKSPWGHVQDELSRSKLREVFDTTEAMDSYLAQASVDARTREMLGRALGGSQTAERAAILADEASGGITSAARVAGAARQLVSGDVSGSMRAVADLAQAWQLGDAGRADVARLLTARGEDAWKALDEVKRAIDELQQLAARGESARERAAGTAGAVTGGMMGR